jgi:transcriptional regulator with XRE-family HTH domain
MNKVQKDNSFNQDVFTRNFNRYLAHSGRKQIEVARAIGVSTGTISDWKIGRSYPRMDKIQALADFFEIQKSDLVEEVNVAKEAVTNKEQQVLDLFHKIPDGNKDAAIKMLQALADNL